MVTTTKTVAIDDIDVSVYVRRELNEDRWMQMAEKIVAGEKLPLIDIDPDNKLKDGRHRIQANVYLGQTHIDAVVTSRPASRVDLIAQAWGANLDGPLPPTQADIEHATGLLMDQRQGLHKIADILRLPVPVARAYMDKVRSKRGRQQMQRARTAVSRGELSPTQASEQYGVKLALLKRNLSGRKGEEEEGISGLESEMSRRYKSVALQNNVALKKVITKFDDGDISEADARDFFKRLRGLQRNHSKALDDAVARFEALPAVKQTNPEEAEAA